MSADKTTIPDAVRKRRCDCTVQWAMTRCHHLGCRKRRVAPDPTDADRKALARCHECFSDGEGTDVARPALDRLTALGWLDKIGRARWQVSDQGEAVLAEMGHAT